MEQAKPVTGQAQLCSLCRFRIVKTGLVMSLSVVGGCLEFIPVTATTVPSPYGLGLWSPTSNFKATGFYFSDLIIV